jgi:hypothetical protein
VIRLPDRKMLRSKEEHNADLGVFCDWLQIVVAVDEDAISKVDALDSLLDARIYDDQDFAGEFVSSAWAELRKRRAWLGLSSNYEHRDGHISRTGDWRSHAALTFCLVTSLAPNLSEWTSTFGSDYVSQGDLFERISASALPLKFVDWKFEKTGWTPETPTNLASVVTDLAKMIYEEPGDVNKWASGKAHEAGVDLAWYLPFSDNRSGLPTYLGQCASGANWPTKIDSPRLHVWEKLINFTHPPAKAMVIPFALSDQEFQERRLQVNGLMIDRHRLFPPSPESEWIDQRLNYDLCEWLQPRIEWILTR